MRKCTRCFVPMKLDPRVFILPAMKKDDEIALKLWTCTKCGQAELSLPPEQPKYRRIKQLEEAADLANQDLNITRLAEGLY